MNNLTISVGKSRHDTHWQAQRISWPDLLERLRTPIRTTETAAEFAAMPAQQRAEIKDVGGFVGGDVRGGRRKSGNVQSRCLLALDADYGTMELWDVWTSMYGLAAGVYATHSHTPDKPRLRFLFPLARPVAPDEYEAIARRVASWLDIDAFDDTTYQPGRLMYWPSMPKDAEYIFEAQDGPWLDPDAVLSEYNDWHDTAEWPTSSHQTHKLRARAKAQGEPTDKPGIVGAFCRVYDVPAAIAKFLSTIYDAAQEGRYTYRAGSAYGGAVLYDGGKFIYSHHDSDPAGGRLCNAFDLVRLHLYGELDGDKDLPANEMPSFKAMQEMCQGDSAVLEELEARIKANALEDFENEAAEGLIKSETDYTDQGNAVAFADAYKRVLCWQDNLRWVAWDGVRWQTDAEGAAKLLMMRFTDGLLSAAQAWLRVAPEGSDDRKRAAAALSWACKSRSAAKIKATLDLAKPMLESHRLEDFDADPWALNTPGGIVDLKTGKLRAHDAAALCTACTAVAPAGGKTPMYSDFMRRITNADADFERYLQDVAGMALVGAVYEEGMVISYGPGGNGKSTLFGAWKDVLGDYAGGIRQELLVVKGSGAEAFGLEQVRGKRLVIAGETDEGANMSVSIMKRLTSRDEINANPKGRDPFSFKPTHTLVLHTNHLFKLRSLDGGTRRRIAVAPFETTIAPEQMVTNFGEQLVAQEGPQILAWMIEGAKRFCANRCKIKKPEIVKQSTAAYLDREDWLKAFLSECTREGTKVKSAELYGRYVTWATSNGEKMPRRSNDFAAALEARGYERRHTNIGNMWLGLEVTEEI